MTTRTRYETVTFPTAFTLPGVDGTIPPGSYEVATEEELLEQLSFPAYHRLSTTMRIPMTGGGSASYQVVRVDPADLEAAQGKTPAPAPAVPLKSGAT